MKTKDTTKRFERITDLALALRFTEQPLTLQELVQRVPGYPSDVNDQSVRTAFERDKRTLRAHGLSIATDGPEGLHATGYTAAPALGEGIALDLSDQEISALALALGVVRMKDSISRDAMAKLIGHGSIGMLANQHCSAILKAAIASRWPVRFTYRRRVCDIEPYGVVEDNGHLFLVGRDRHGEGRVRSFQLELMSDGPLLDIDETFELPLQFDPSAELFEESSEPFVTSDEEFEAMVSRGLDAGDQYARLMAILSVLERANSNGQVCKLSLIAQSFQLRLAGLVEELELAACFGIAPFSPDQMLDIVVDQESDVVLVHGLEQFARPADLTSDEARAAARAAQAVLTIADLQDLQVLESALTKLTKHVELAELDSSSGNVLPIWPALVRLNITELDKSIERFIVGEPTVLNSGQLEVVAYLADRRWESPLLESRSDKALERHVLSLQSDATYERRIAS